MAMAKPIVASDLDQIGSVLRPGLPVEALPAHGPRPDSGELAVLAEPGDVEALALGIRFLVERPEWRTVLGANARARALQRYTWRDHVAAILERLHEVLGPSPRLGVGRGVATT
jgi:glycosyltransferase involved in cell wall biosynthesis